MPLANLKEVQIHYREDGQGFPVILVHGYTGSIDNWEPTIPALAPYYRTIALDLRGHGYSSKPTQPEGYTLGSMAEDLYRFLRYLGIEECYLVGHSMGGMIAQEFAIAHPERLRALVLVGTAATLPQGLRSQERIRLLEIARDQGMEAVFEAQLNLNPNYQQFRQDPGLLQSLQQKFLMTSREAYLYCALAIANRQPTVDKLPSIKAPTLILCGQDDEPFVQPSRVIHERIPDSRLVYIPSCGHSPQMEKPEEFNGIMLDFLTKADTGQKLRPLTD